MSPVSEEKGGGLCRPGVRDSLLLLLHRPSREEPTEMSRNRPSSQGRGSGQSLPSGARITSCESLMFNIILRYIINS